MTKVPLTIDQIKELSAVGLVNNPVGAANLVLDWAEQASEFIGKLGKLDEDGDFVVKTMDHPEANGRHAISGENQWTLTLPLENGINLKVKLGQKGRDIVFGMLMADCQDSGEKEPM